MILLHPINNISILFDMQLKTFKYFTLLFVIVLLNVLLTCKCDISTFYSIT